MSDKTKDAIKKQVAAELSADNVREDEVVVKDNGDIILDRRSTYPLAKPGVVGRWKK